LHGTGFSQKYSKYQIRKYTTHKDSVNLDHQPSHLSQALDTGRNRSSVRPDTVGPFQLGISQQALRSGEKVKKWSELGTGGKSVLFILPHDATLANAALLNLPSRTNSFTNEEFSRHSHWRKSCNATDIYHYL
jgi:hypothetical protein